MATGGELIPNKVSYWRSRTLALLVACAVASFVLWLLLSYAEENPNGLSSVDFGHRMDSALMLAALVLPATIVWRLPYYRLSVPVGTLMFWGLMVNAGFLLLFVDREYDSIAPGLMVFFAVPLGGAYCLIVADLCEAISPLCERHWKASRSTQANRTHSIIGFVIWSVVALFCFLLPFVRSPLEWRGDPTFAGEYFAACWPILLLVVTMVLMYAVSLLRIWLKRQPEQPPG